jgi:hypothetical protein
MTVISALRRLRQEFKANLGYTRRPCFKKKKMSAARLCCFL